jgi:hypothetical protein
MTHRYTALAVGASVLGGAHMCTDCTRSLRTAATVSVERRWSQPKPPCTTCLHRGSLARLSSLCPTVER